MCFSDAELCVNSLNCICSGRVLSTNTPHAVVSRSRVALLRVTVDLKQHCHVGHCISPHAYFSGHSVRRGWRPELVLSCYGRHRPTMLTVCYGTSMKAFLAGTLTLVLQLSYLPVFIDHAKVQVIRPSFTAVCLLFERIHEF